MFNYLVISITGRAGFQPAKTHSFICFSTASRGCIKIQRKQLGRDIVLSLSASKRLDVNMIFADKDKTMSLRQIERVVRKSVLPDSNILD